MPDEPYEVVTDGPPALSWDDYSEEVIQEWAIFLKRPPANEREVHKFLEKHPCLVPGHDAFVGATPENYFHPPNPLRQMLVSQPPLPGITKKVPDFLWLPNDSQTQWAVMVEIEDPKKRWFTDRCQPTAQLTQALSQIASWKQHLSSPTNQLLFREMYGPIGYHLEFKYCLIYGRRDDPSRTHDAIGSLKALAPDIVTMTYDRLRPDEGARNQICVRHLNGNFKAITVPATYKTSPSDAWYVKDITNKSQAVHESPHFTPDRADFLASRFAYWEEQFSDARYQVGRDPHFGE
ncbi:Shedu anti-phage system protein SduA domain-containing protein [Lentzea indica]|nr:Shedu anti-phage system protein SduA domain-containing protein [Lentzea indica]